MLNANEILHKKFSVQKKNGYDIEEVQDFLQSVAQTVTETQGENLALKKKNEELLNAITEYRSKEDSVREALIAAYQMKDDTLKTANEQAESLLARAQTKAKSIVEDAYIRNQEVMDKLSVQISEKQAEYESIARQVAQFKQHILALYRQQMEGIDQLPEPEPADEPSQGELLEQAPDALLVDSVQPADEPVSPQEEIQVEEDQTVSFTQATNEIFTPVEEKADSVGKKDENQLDLFHKDPMAEDTITSLFDTEEISAPQQQTAVLPQKQEEQPATEPPAAPKADKSGIFIDFTEIGEEEEEEIKKKFNDLKFGSAFDFDDEEEDDGDLKGGFFKRRKKKSE